LVEKCHVVFFNISSLAAFGSRLHSMLTFIGIGGMTISIIATLLLGLAIKKGSRNLQLLLGEKA
jgi:hypothetical protein